MLRNYITQIIDFFYPLFSKIFDRQTFRYAACGGSNTLLDIFLYYISYNFILKKQIIHTPVIAISPHIGAFLLAFSITFPLGFYLMRTVVFTDSYLRGRVQLFRYFSVVMFSLFLNYIFIKFFVEVCHFYPTVSKIITTAIVIVFSYFSQRKFSFAGNR
ncbi:MAG: GtrA family protein [Chitinophagales bacterium]|nr:GtrA family protein [Chitinophagales bacterium]